MVGAVPRIREIDRAGCRAHVEERFSASAMADAYIEAYTRCIELRLPCAA